MRLLLVWAGASTATFAAAWAARSWAKGRVTRPWRMHLPGLLVLCVLAGAAAAFLYDWLSARAVSLPAELEQSPVLGRAVEQR